MVSMDLFRNLIFASCCILITKGICISNLSALRKAVFRGYDKHVKPDEQVVVRFGLNLLNLEICPQKQVLTSNTWITMNWEDSRLKWDPSEWDNVTSINIEVSEVWMPDIVPYNGELQRPNYITLNENIPKAVLMSSGEIMFIPPAILRTFCSVEAETWPWGQQNCSIVFGSWTNHKDTLDVQGSEIETYLFTNSRIEIVSTRMDRVEATYACCPETYPTLHYEIIFKQKVIVQNNKFITPETKKPKKDSSEEEN